MAKPKRIRIVTIPREEVEKKKREAKRRGEAKLQIVHRRKPREKVFLRIPAKTLREPTFAQAVWRYIFGEASYDLYGTKGTVKLRDGREISRDAYKMPAKLRQKAVELGWDMQRVRWYGLQERRAKKARQWLLKFKAYLEDLGSPESDLSLEVLAEKCEKVLSTIGRLS